jgi:hypothetical protein
MQRFPCIFPCSFPKRRADFGNDSVAGFDLAVGHKLRRHADRRIGHWCDAEKVDDIGTAERDVAALDEIGEVALGQPRPQAVAQSGHAAVGQRGADAQPVDFLQPI